MTSVDLQDLETTLHHLTNQLNTSLVSVPDTNLFMRELGYLDHFNTLWLNATTDLLLNQEHHTDVHVKIEVLKEVVYHVTTILNINRSSSSLWNGVFVYINRRHHFNADKMVECLLDLYRHHMQLRKKVASTLQEHV